MDILVGRGDGTFDDPIAHSANGYEHTGVAVADFNGDGLLDAVTSDRDTGTLSLLLGNGAGALWYAGAFAVGSLPTAVAVGDFNGDGRPDAAVANGGSSTVSVLLNAADDNPPWLRIHDVTVTEGNTGAALADFVVTLSAASTETVTVAYATADSTAAAGSDYQAASGTLTFAPGETSRPAPADNELRLVLHDRAQGLAVGDARVGCAAQVDEEGFVTVFIVPVAVDQDADSL